MIDTKYIAMIQKQTQRIKSELSELYVIEDGVKRVKPGVTKAQLQAVLGELEKIQEEYNKMVDVTNSYRVEVEASEAKKSKTREKLLSFEQELGVKFPASGIVRAFYNF